MKTLLAFIILVSSVNVFAYSAGQVTRDAYIGTVVVTSVSIWTSLGSPRLFAKEALQVMKDSQDYFVSGEISVFLEKQIKDKLAQDESLTSDEALEVVMDEAQEILDANR